MVRRERNKTPPRGITAYAERQTLHKHRPRTLFTCVTASVCVSKMYSLNTIQSISYPIVNPIQDTHTDTDTDTAHARRARDDSTTTDTHTHTHTRT